MRHCATCRKVAGSISDGVIAIFHFNPNCGPGVDSVSNRNEYQEHLLVGKGGRCRRFDNLATLMCQLSRKSAALNFLQP